MTSRLILLVNESNTEEEKVIRLCLNHVAGWNVVSISSKYKELSLLLKNQPDAIIINALLTNINGLSSNQTGLIHNLKKHPVTQSSPILLLIDTANWLTTVQFTTWRIAGAIVKPFDPITLPSQIMSMLGWNEPKERLI